jgi:excisionase family DNA binding protein
LKPDDIATLQHIRKIVARAGVQVDIDERATQAYRAELRFIDALISKGQTQLKAEEKQKESAKNKLASSLPVQQEKPQPRVYRMNTATEMLGVSRNTIYRLVRNGELVLVKVGAKASGITSESLIAFLAKKPAI